MDPVTQGALGAAWARPLARGSKIGWASAIGCVAGMAPDADVLIRSSTDPLLALEYHRHFTHALAFIPVGALICALVLYPWAKRAFRFRDCYGFSLLGYASHGLLDACTTYGTLLYWPFSDRRVAWDLVSVIDPFFTVPLIVAVAFSVSRRRAVFAVVGLAWCVAYLGFGFVQNQRAAEAIRSLAASRGHAPVTVDAKPAFANLLLWRTIYAFDGRFFVDAVRAGLDVRVFEGEARTIFDAERELPWLDHDSQQRRDLERFEWFADGYLVADPARPNRVVDLRYSLVPNRADGFWGIELERDAAPDAHVTYVTMRARSTAEGRELMRMLWP